MEFLANYLNLILIVVTFILTIIWLIDKTVWQQYKSEYEMDWFVRISHELVLYVWIVLIVRSFIFESYNIPSGSMEPQLQTGDYIIVNKFAYGLRVPLLNERIIGAGVPKRGDVIIFKFPQDTATTMIKRVIGLPGDHLEWKATQLYINGIKVVDFPINSQLNNASQEFKMETLGDKTFSIRTIPFASTFRNAEYLQNTTLANNPNPLVIPTKQSDYYQAYIPPNYYFVMGDNRDDSLDSRFWGLVPDKNIKGKAELIWLHHEPKHILPTLSRDGWIK